MSATTPASNTTADAEQFERAQRVDEAVHSVQMEGIDVTPAWQADAAEAVAGRISTEEFGARTRSRYGVGH
jgi:Antitoxin VbhA